MLKTKPPPIDAGMHAAPQSAPKFLLQGIDTIQCCYYLVPHGPTAIDFVQLRALRESLRDIRDPEPTPMKIGNMEFLLAPHGSSAGYPFIVSNADYRIEFGEHNTPSFYVTYRSEALWRVPPVELHRRFLAWAETIGFVPAKPETISR